MLGRGRGLARWHEPPRGGRFVWTSAKTAAARCWRRGLALLAALALAGPAGALLGEGEPGCFDVDKTQQVRPLSPQPTRGKARTRVRGAWSAV